MRFTVLVVPAVIAGANVAAATAQQINPDLYSGMHWRNIGPPRSGRVAATVGVPGDPTVYYLAMPQGGVWKSTNAGTTWKPAFDAVGVASTASIAVAPSMPNVVYVGAGAQATSGGAVYKSADGGATWTNIGPAATGTAGAIIVDPRNADVVLVAASGQGSDPASNGAGGVYRSTDGGRNWTQVLGRNQGLGASVLDYDYYDPQVIYATLSAGGGGRGGGAVAVQPAQPLSGTGVYRSTDGGVTWQPLSGKGLHDGAQGFSYAVASGTHGKRLYALVRGGGRGGGGAGGTGGVYRSDDGGDTWVFGTGRVASASGRIYADPKNPDVVYLMGTSMYRSVDGGKHFVSYMGAPSGDDPRNLWIDPVNPRRMILGVDQGPTISVDGGETWSLWYNLPNGQFYRVSTDYDFPYHVCGPQQDSGTACVLSRGDFGEIRPQDWFPGGGFENGFLIADPLHPRWLYTQGWYHVLRRFDRTTSQVTVLYQPGSQDRFGGAPPLAFSPQDPHVLYMGAQYIMMSNDNAQTWHTISPDLTTPAVSDSTQFPATPRRAGPALGANIQSLAPSPVSAGLIWAGTSNGVVQLTRDGGKTWSNVTPPNMPPGGINVLDPSHTSAGIAYFALLSRDNHPHIYRTSDYGQAWQEIVSGMPDGQVVRVVREDPVNPNVLYAGTVASFWISFDRGDHWQSLQLNLPSTIVSDITVHGSDLVISTYGRGFWILDDVTPLRQAREAAAASTTAFLFRPDSATRARWDNTQDTPLPPETPTGENPPEGAIIDYYLKAPVPGPITLTVSDRAGRVLREYSDVAPPIDTLMPNAPEYWFMPPAVLSTSSGMHRIAWDLRYADPKILPFGYSGNMLDYVEYTLSWHAIPGHTPRSTVVGPTVLPGAYTVKLTAGGQAYTRDVAVTADPRVLASPADLAAQLRQEERMMGGLAVSYDAFYQLQTLRAALTKVMTQADGKAGADQITVAARAIDDTASRLGAPQGVFGTANRDLARYLVDMEVGDGAPVPSVIAAIDSACHKVDVAAASVRTLEASVARLNGLLTHAQLAAVPGWAVPAGSPCGAGGSAVR